MASLEGGKKQNYASSSESEGEDNSGSLPSVPPPVYDGMPQTGPKGVIMDYHRHLQEKKLLKEIDNEAKLEMIKQSAMTVKPRSEDNTDDSKNLVAALNDIHLDDTDPFLQQYRAKRIRELKDQAKPGVKRRIFGNLIELRGDKFSAAIDSAPPDTYVVMHIYDDFFVACTLMNKCLVEAAKMYPTVKFCRVRSFQLQLSKEFQDKGLPALLVYKSDELIGNHLNVTSVLGDQFTVHDVVGFLLEQNCLPSGPQAEVQSPYNLSPRQTPTKEYSSNEDD